MSRRRDLQRMMTHVRATAAQLIAGGEAHGSILLALTPTGGQVLGVDPAPGETLNDAIRRCLQATHAWGYIYCNEAWVTSNAGAFQRGEVARVIDLPREDRDEELIMVAVLRGQWVHAQCARIEATPTGRRLGPWQVRSTALFLGDASVVKDW